MATEGSHVRLKLPNAPRLAEAAVGAVEFISQRAGLDEAGQRSLAEATAAACRREMQQLTAPGLVCEVFVEDFADRVEVTLERPDPAPDRSLRPAKYPQLDDVEYSREGATARTRLVKYAPGARPR